MGSKSKVLVIGGTGYIRKLLVEASAKAAHPHLRSGPCKRNTIHNKTMSIKIMPYLWYQMRFFPSEFGNDVDRVHAVEPVKTAYAIKAQIRRAVEAEGIPFTYVCNNYFAGVFLCNLGQVEATVSPRDKVVIHGDAEFLYDPYVAQILMVVTLDILDSLVQYCNFAAACFNKEEDVATYTIRTIDDPRTLNKILYIRPADNIYSLNELVLLWEKKNGHSIERRYISEEQLLKNIEGKIENLILDMQ
ncbi:hypothetical protein Ancab_018092 [Ancistrocladus abbreviatus]